MVKRERLSSPISTDSSLAPHDSISADEKPLIKKTKSPKKEGKGTKTPWSVEEDTALITIMDEVIKNHLWPAIKASGNERLIARTGYGCQYHAKLLMKAGKSKK
ncbi:uncharacterized protein IL334_000280 [Kwoniella shivajii]|uniref:Myb-like domain-containing protein n=1 Tax=Kwoniella shivajii TaxID=564305 RepID=A0ABZ1CP27_9TREE|nr:hypothetical protein IL334_000280 [Kwoniella shivajii]